MLWPLSKPKIYVIFGFLISIVHGSTPPILGIFTVKALFIMINEPREKMEDGVRE